MEEIDFNDIEMDEKLEMKLTSKLDLKLYFILRSNDAKDVRKAVRELFSIKKGLSRMERKILALILDYPKNKLMKSIRKNQDLIEEQDREADECMNMEAEEFEQREQEQERRPKKDPFKTKKHEFKEWVTIDPTSKVNIRKCFEG